MDYLRRNATDLASKAGVLPPMATAVANDSAAALQELASAAAHAAPLFDTVIRHGRVIDGSGTAPVRDYRARCKEVLVMQGILKHAHMRPPLTSVGAEDRQRLKQVLVEAGEL